MIDLREYFPADSQIELRKSTGEKNTRYLLRKNPSGYDSTYANFLNLGKPGSLYLWRKEYWRNGAWQIATDGLLFMGDDMSVTEVGDWMYTPAGGVVVGYKSVGVPTGLAWSGVGGINSSPVIVEANVWQQLAPGAAYLHHGQQTYSKCGLIEHYDSFTPDFGRSADGIWAEGLGKTYDDVVRIVMYHGNKTPSSSPIRCELNSPLSARGPYYQPYKDYNSYAIELWLAKGVGIIQENTPFIEDGGYWGITNCRGSALGEPLIWSKFIDEA